MPKHQIFVTAFAKIYPLYVQKAERKSRTKEEVNQISYWLTGYDKTGLHRQIEQGNDFQPSLPKLQPFIEVLRWSKIIKGRLDSEWAFIHKLGIQ